MKNHLIVSDYYCLIHLQRFAMHLFKTFKLDLYIYLFIFETPSLLLNKKGHYFTEETQFFFCFIKACSNIVDKLSMSRNKISSKIKRNCRRQNCYLKLKAQHQISRRRAKIAICIKANGWLLQRHCKNCKFEAITLHGPVGEHVAAG